MSDEKTGDKPMVGFVGTGRMGARMAMRLIDAGYPVTVYNRTRAKAEMLLEHGAAWAEVPKQLAANCDIVMSSLSDDKAVKSVFYGSGGIVEGCHPGSICIDLSTIYPDTSREICGAISNRGGCMLDAAVSGSTPQAEAGNLVIMVGGDESAYKESRPVLEVLGKSNYMGHSGTGATMKLVVNTLLGLGMQAVAEAVSLGEKAGLNKDHILEVLGETGVVAPGHKMKFENIRKESYSPAFTIQLMAKDFGLILRQAAAVSASMPATAVAQQICAAESAKGLEEDYSAVAKLMQELAALYPD